MSAPPWTHTIRPMRNKLNVVAILLAVTVALTGSAWAGQSPEQAPEPVVKQTIETVEQAPELVVEQTIETVEQAPEPQPMPVGVRAILAAVFDLETARDEVMVAEGLVAETIGARGAAEAALDAALAAADAAVADVEVATDVHSDAVTARKAALSAFMAATAGL